MSSVPIQRNTLKGITITANVDTGDLEITIHPQILQESIKANPYTSHECIKAVCVCRRKVSEAGYTHFEPEIIPPTKRESIFSKIFKTG